MKRGVADVVIVGAGIIGCAIARELAARGSSVIAVERDSPGRRATWAAAGMLSPLGEAGGGGPFLELADASLIRFADFAGALRNESGIDVEYRTNGKLHISLGGADDELRRLARGPVASRFDVRLLDGDEVRQLEPELTETVTTALFVGRDHRVNNRLLAQALHASAVSAGVQFRTANPVAAITTQQDSVTGVRLASGEQLTAQHVILAAGAWSAQLEGLPRPLPVRPVKGQMFSVDSRARAPDRPAQPMVQRVLYAPRCYIIPRDDGRLLIGATVEDVGFRKGATVRGVAGLMDAAVELLPAIAELPLVETWAGFRPGTPDGMPIIGTDPDLRGLVYATGHYRNGILLAPITAACVADIVTGQDFSMSLDAFAIGRFS